MDARHFDAFVSAIARGASRRRLLAAIPGGALSMMAGLSLESALTKKKKRKKRKKGKKPKPPQPEQCQPSETPCGDACCVAGQTCIDGECLGACQFSDDNDLKVRTLQADCATIETIVIPAQFTLDGANRTIHLAGPISGYQSAAPGQIAVRAGILIKDGSGSVKNLTIDQDSLQCEGTLRQSAIVMENGTGVIEDVDLRLTQNNRNCFRGGINAQTAADNQVVIVRNVTIAGNRFSGIEISAATGSGDGVAGEISDCTISGPGFGMVLSGPKNGFPITGNNVTANIGITLGSFPTNVLIDDNTIAGLSGATNLFGVNFSEDAAGTVSNNTISGFTCGIAIQDGAGLVGESNNTLSGNTTPICDPP